MTLRNIIDTRRILSLSVDKNDVIVDKTSESVEQEIRRNAPKSLVITKTTNVLEKNGSEVSKPSIRLDSSMSLHPGNILFQL